MYLISSIGYNVFSLKNYRCGLGGTWQRVIIGRGDIPLWGRPCEGDDTPVPGTSTEETFQYSVPILSGLPSTWLVLLRYASLILSS